MISPALRRALASLLAVPCLGLTGVAQGGTLTIDIPSCATPTATVVGGSVTIGCGSTGGGGGAPTGCSISGPSSVAAGGVATLEMTCATGSPTAYSWSGGSVSGSSTKTVSATITATTTFTATASNESGSSGPVTKTVSVTGGEPVGGGTISCSGFTNTRVVDVPWTGAPAQVYSYKFGPFGPDDAIVARFTVPAGFVKTLGAGRISVAEYLGSPTTRQAALSSTPCEFSRGITSGLVGEGQTLTMWFTAGTSASAMLKPGQTVYFNIRNKSCTGSTCNVVINLTPPL